MTTKLTLTLDDSVIKNAKEYAAMQNTSLSRMVEGYFRKITNVSSDKITSAELPPITRKLLGIATGGKEVTGKSDKDLLLDALEEKFL